MGLSGVVEPIKGKPAVFVKDGRSRVMEEAIWVLPSTTQGVSNEQAAQSGEGRATQVAYNGRAAPISTMGKRALKLPSQARGEQPLWRVAPEFQDGQAAHEVRDGRTTHEVGEQIRRGEEALLGLRCVAC
ncbi:unnamed protein product [Ilex paraguariensis]|uniref:Uncharacterized protein n=1 Tax=Ilex paraguariensis TaxID=185542 RepID=A0ABC8SK10_9AQUA